MNNLIIDYTETKQPDFIGDIHGHYDALIQLFQKMGYTHENGLYTHPERFPVFIGDYIDRGPKIFETLELVKRMQESGNAIALMGNHELNYLELHYQDDSGQSFRSQSKKSQVKETDAAFNGKDKTLYLDWMSKLPIAIDSEHFRAVHAQWDDDAIAIVREANIQFLDQNGLRKAHNNSDLYKSIEIVLKGKEIELPQNLHYYDHGATKRTEARIKWWQARKRTLFGVDFASLPKHMIDKDISDFNHDYNFYYKKKQIPVFFGHYWMDAKKVKLMSSNACCVDYSIAKEGILVSYRHNIGQVLKNEHFIKHNSSKKIKKDNDVLISDYEKMFREAYKYLYAFYEHWTLAESKVVAKYLCKKFYRLKYIKGITIIEIVSEGCAKIRKPKSQITSGYWLSGFSIELEKIYSKSKTEEYNDEYNAYTSLIQNENFSGFDNYKNIELYENEIINGDTLSPKEKDLFELLINLSLADLEGDFYKTLNKVAVELGLTEKDTNFRKAYQRLREKLLNSDNKGSLDLLTFTTNEDIKKDTVIADFFKYIDFQFIRTNHLQAYRFSEQEMKKMIELKKIFEDNQYSIDRFPEVYYDDYYDNIIEFSEWTSEKWNEVFIKNDNHSTSNGLTQISPEIIDLLGIYTDFGREGEKEGVIILFKNRIESLKLNHDYVRFVVLMHELGHWLSHWPKCNNKNWSQGYSAVDKKTHESLAQLIAYWAVNGNPELEKTLTNLTPIDIENPYYLYNNLKEFSKVNILRKINIIRKYLNPKKSDEALYDVLKMSENEFDKKYFGSFHGDTYVI